MEGGAATGMTGDPHRYRAQISWQGNRGGGTVGYTAYDRAYRVVVPGKPVLDGSADPAFRGDPTKLNPEELFLSALAACHMLFYLSLCARSGVIVLEYADEACGTLQSFTGGGGRFAEVALHPIVTIAHGHDVAEAAKLHERAHALCFLANSCRVPIHHHPTIHVAPPEPRQTP